VLGAAALIAVTACTDGSGPHNPDAALDDPPDASRASAATTSTGHLQRDPRDAHHDNASVIDRIDAVGTASVG
jgi:hypothetical protein